MLEREAPRHAEFPIVVVAVIVVVVAAMVSMRLRVEFDPPQECPVYSRAPLSIIVGKNCRGSLLRRIRRGPGGRGKVPVDSLVCIFRHILCYRVALSHGAIIPIPSISMTHYVGPRGLF